MLRKFLRIIMGTPSVLPEASNPRVISLQKLAQKERELIKEEAKIGATLFGNIPAGHHREFFCLDRRTWIWFEEWYDVNTKTNHQMNIRYEFQPRGVLKTVDGVSVGFVEGRELTNLLSAIQQYHDRIASEVYGQTFSYAS